MTRPIIQNPRSRPIENLIPAIIQHADTRQVLMLAYMNQEAFEQTLRTQRVTFFSRSRNELWEKGATSGNYLDLVEIRQDCDEDTLLVRARPRGPSCHTGTWTCFAEDEIKPETNIHFLNTLEKIISDRSVLAQDKTSYVASLFAEGLDRIAQKVGEEAVETIIAAKNQDSSAFTGEAADLLFHLMVLLRAKGSSLSEVVKCLQSRHPKESDS